MTYSALNIICQDYFDGKSSRSEYLELRRKVINDILLEQIFRDEVNQGENASPSQALSNNVLYRQIYIPIFIVSIICVGLYLLSFKIDGLFDVKSSQNSSEDAITEKVNLNKEEGISLFQHTLMTRLQKSIELGVENDSSFQSEILSLWNVSNESARLAFREKLQGYIEIWSVDIELEGDAEILSDTLMQLEKVKGLVTTENNKPSHKEENISEPSKTLEK